MPELAPSLNNDFEIIAGAIIRNFTVPRILKSQISNRIQISDKVTNEYRIVDHEYQIVNRIPKIVIKAE